MQDLLNKLTIEEKALLLTGASNMQTYEIERLSICPKKLADGPHGIRHRGDEWNCVAFPAMCAVASSWDRDLLYKMGQAIGEDCIEHNIDMILGPGMNIKRNLFGGRNFEYVSEDPVVAGQLAASYIRGVEDTGVATSLKHFACNSQESFRLCSSIEVDERTLREIYLRGFEIAIKEGKPTSVMCAYNKLHGIWCSENAFLLNDVLRNEWKYEGFVVSDWGAVHDTCRAIMAGLDLQMPTVGDIVEKVKKGLETGVLTEEALNKAVSRILAFSMKDKAKKRPYNRQALHELATDIEKQSICLLKNRVNLLPLDPKKCKKVAVIGTWAQKPHIGGIGSSEVYPDAEFIDTPLQAIRKALPHASVDYFDDIKTEGNPESFWWSSYGKWFNNIDNYDVILFFAGVPNYYDTEARDRTDWHIPAFVEDFIGQVHDRSKKMVVITGSGSPYAYSYRMNQVDTLLHTWLGGEGVGTAIADVLFGKANPSGKLPETFPKTPRKDLDMVGTAANTIYSEGMKIGYRYYDEHPDEVWFPFGHGLSYTTFAYSAMEVQKKKNGWKISCKVTNTGDYDGKETIMLFTSHPYAITSMPQKELRDFVKVSLKAGETKEVVFDLPESALSYYNVCLKKWVIEDGLYEFLLASSARDIRLKYQEEIHGISPYTQEGYLFFTQA